MALNLYGTTNYETVEPLSFAYSRTPVILKPAPGSSIETQYRYTRTATKAYKFKGLSETALKSCLSAKQIQYTRKFMEWRFYALYWRCPYELYRSEHSFMAPPPYTDQVASFSVSRSDAPVYDLQIRVNETVALYDTEDYDPSTLSGVTHIEQLFTTKTTYTGPNPLWETYAGEEYYKSYAYSYDYDENLSGDVIVS